ncbi:uncharacterized protein LOC143038522 [Oratosquilla oratoria]|uniref:uncharacterized protein LOC143038522 n=1 Tax=Oratosquilla oratoria TaxID=337810 RepID=UPI003F75758C
MSSNIDCQVHDPLGGPTPQPLTTTIFQVSIFPEICNHTPMPPYNMIPGHVPGMRSPEQPSEMYLFDIIHNLHDNSSPMGVAKQPKACYTGKQTTTCCYSCNLKASFTPTFKFRLSHEDNSLDDVVEAPHITSHLINPILTSSLPTFGLRGLPSESLAGPYDD